MLALERTAAAYRRDDDTDRFEAANARIAKLKQQLSSQ